MSNLSMELNFYKSAHEYYFDRLAELNSKLSHDEIDRDTYMIETRNLTTATMERYDDILEHIKKGYDSTKA